MSDFSKEGGHWYHPNGDPAYEVPNKSRGGMRPTTIRDAIKLSLKPSVTGVISVWPKPALDVWKQEQVLMASLTLPRDEGEKEKDWINRIRQDSKEQAIQAATKGTEIHAAIEQFYLNGTVNPQWAEWIEAVRKVISEYFATAIWATEKSFVNDWYGGKVDMHAANVPVVLDIKTKDGNLEGKLAWDEQAMQLVAYRGGLNLPDAQCGNLFVSRDRPLARMHIWEEGELEKAREDFRACYELWVRYRKYDPRA